MANPQFIIRKTSRIPDCEPSNQCSTWETSDVARLDWFHPKSSTHRPESRLRMLHDGTSLFARFAVSDRYVRCRQTTCQGRVSEDSCVEIFLQPHPNNGYFALEMNCGGTFSFFYIEDPTRMPDRLFRKYTVVPLDQCEQINVTHTMPKSLPDEIETPVEWQVTCRIPLSLLKQFTGNISTNSGSQWRGNFFKCGDKTSHPHWASWSPFGELLRFHQPEHFGTMLFE